MKTLTCRCGKEIQVDDEDQQLLEKKLHCVNGEAIYVVVGKGNRRIYASLGKQILKTANMVDHKDRNPHNNQRNNLRETNGQSQNQANRGRLKNNTSGYKGVSFYPRYAMWVATIGFHSKHITIGYFKTREEAALAYNNKAKELFGEFAVLNVLSLLFLLAFAWAEMAIMEFA